MSQTDMTTPVEECEIEQKSSKTLTKLVVSCVAKELEASKDDLKETLIEPLIRMLYQHLFPYVMLVCAVMLIILLTSLCTCAMFALFFFTRSRPQ